MTQLPNPFLNSVDGSPPSPAVSTADSACRLQNVARPDATAERDPHPISESTLGPATGVDTAAGPDLADHPVPAAVAIYEPTSSTGGPQETPASAPSKNPDVGVLADRIDWHEFFEAVMDERIVLFELYDEVPLFLRDGDHLRRWTA